MLYGIRIMALPLLALSDPRAVREFAAHAEASLLSRGRWDADVRAALEREAKRQGLHRADAAQVLERARNSPPVIEALAHARLRAPQERWLRVEVPRLLRVALVLDASASAAPHREEIAAYAGELARVLETLADVEVVALGRTGSLAGSADEALEAYRALPCRASLLAPTCAWLRERSADAHREAPPCLVLLGAGRIFDLEDWLGDPLMSGTRFVSFGGAMTGGAAPESGLAADALAQQLLNFPATIRLGGDGAVPFWWDEGSARREGKYLEWEVATPAALLALETRSGWMCAPQAEPEGTLARSDGPEVPLSFGAGKPEPPPQWQQVPPAHHAAARAWIEGRDHPVLTFLPPGAGGFLLLRDEGAFLSWALHAAEALKTTSGAVILRAAGGAGSLYTLEDGTWTREPGAGREGFAVEEGTRAFIL